MSRVYFADVYKEYEILHRYVSRLTDKYKQALMEDKIMSQTGQENGNTEATEDGDEKKKQFIKVRCKQVRTVFLKVKITYF